MARRKTGRQNIRSLSKTASGNSYSITLPIEVVRRWRWKERQKIELVIDYKKKRIVLRDWRPKRKKNK